MNRFEKVIQQILVAIAVEILQQMFDVIEEWRERHAIYPRVGRLIIRFFDRTVDRKVTDRPIQLGDIDGPVNDVGQRMCFWLT